jgi:hypothetical protein
MKNFYLIALVFLNLTFVPAKSNAQCISAVQLDGVNEYLHSPFNNYNFSQFTIELWMNAQTFATNVHYVSLYKNAYIVLGNYGTGTIDTWVDGLNPIAISGAPPATNQWHHFAFVYNGTNQIIYLDGNPISVTPSTGNVNVSSIFGDGLVIGARYTQSTQFSQAIYDDVRIWNLPRSQSQLQAFMDVNLAGNETGLVAYYRFEDGIGSSTVTDLTGNGNTLTMYNMEPNTDWVQGNSNSTVNNVTQTISACDSYTWIDGNTYITNNNTAQYTLTNALGCDSIITLDLTITNATSSTITETACESYTLNSQSYTASGTYTQSLTNYLGCDSTITLNLTILNADQQSQSITSCDSYTWSANGTNYTSSGSYTEILTNVNGCDSTVTLNLTVLPSLTPNATLNADNSITATGGTEYQWFNCNTGQTIPNEISETFIPTQNGSYAAIVSNVGSCSDTTDCVSVSTIGMDELVDEKVFIFPNPTHDYVTVQFESTFAKIVIRDAQGKEVYNSYVESNESIQLSHYESGVYTMELSTQNYTYHKRVIKL